MAKYNDGTPLSKGARDAICEEARRVWGTRFQRFSADTIFDYEATVAALEAEVARLREKAEVGEAVGRVITDGRWLEAPDSRHETYRLWDAGVGVGNAKLVVEGKTLAELVAALPTTKGEDDD